MLHSAMSFGELWVVFSLSFVMSLSGALMPGPLLTYTIARTLRTPRRGWLIGARVIAGHAALEGALLCGLVLGVMEFLHAPLAAKVIGVLGAVLLLYMGYGLIRETIRGKGIELAEAGTPAASPAADAPASAPRGSFASRLHPVLAGAVVSMSNPYWWIWWVTIGSAFMLRFDIGFAKWQALLAFFIGHELGDLGWYSAVSVILHLGRRSIPRGVTSGILLGCGVVIIGFAAYLGISPFLA
jgi:threonine/homoserine/homoserine lactone efflux protein